ncbi:MAG: DUF4363 family protein [Clostridia bacterium]|nr:DUF4363 family protein [Clostridia bacterium]MBR2878464.1 DUF4363 family protein [Clostridia bacterium]
MKKVWIAIIFISIIFSVNFIYTHRINVFSDNITEIVNQAAALVDTDYEACGKCIDSLLEELDKSSLLLYSFSNRSKVDDVELASKSAAEYYKFHDTTALKHQLLMIQHRMNELKNSGQFSLKNLLQTKKLSG